MSFKSSAKSWSRMKVSDVGRNLVPNALTTDEEGTLSELN